MVQDLAIQVEEEHSDAIRSHKIKPDFKSASLVSFLKANSNLAKKDSNKLFKKFVSGDNATFQALSLSLVRNAVKIVRERRSPGLSRNFYSEFAFRPAWLT